jgi:hypothetical protein
MEDRHLSAQYRPECSEFVIRRKKSGRKKQIEKKLGEVTRN